MISTLKKENHSISTKVDDLHAQLNAANELVERKKEELATIKNENNELRLRADRLESAYRTLDSTHKEYTGHCDKAVTENRERMQELINKNMQLESQIEQLNTRLQEEKDLRSAQFKHITGIESIPASPYNKSGSHLLALINEYQKLGKHPEEIYTDYFEIREKYFVLLSKVDHSTTVTERLTRELNDKEALFNRLHQKLDNYKEQLNTSQQSIRERESYCRDLEQKFEKMKDEIRNLNYEKKRIEATLNDTTYQLQFILVDVQKRHDPIPTQVQSSAGLVSDITLTPTLEHDQLAFKNVHELVDLNKALREQIYILQEELTSVKNAASSITNEEQAAALNEAQVVISRLDQQLTEKEAEVDSLQGEIQNYKMRLDQQNETSSSNNALEACFNQLKETTDAFAIYRTETSVEISKLKDELQSSRASEREAKDSLVSIQTEIVYLRQKSTNLADTVHRREEELNQSRHENVAINSQLIAKEKEIKEIKETLDECATKIKQLQNENTSLISQLKTKNDSFEILERKMNESNAEKLRLSTLFEGINSRIESLYSTSTEQAEVSKERISKLTNELQSCRDVIAALEKELETFKSVNHQDIQDKYKEALGQTQALKEKLAETEHKLSVTNQEKIAAETKLSEAEANLKKATNADGTSAGTTSISTSCEEHIRSIAELKDRVRVLEDEKDEYVSIVEDMKKKTAEISDEHKKYVDKVGNRMEKLNADLNARNEMVSKAQEVAQKAKEEYDALREKLQNAQNELATENKELKSSKSQLELEVEEKRKQVDTLTASLEEQKRALNDVQEKLHEEEKNHQHVEETATKLREDVAKLESELNDSKNKLKEVKAQLETANEVHKRESAEWAQFQESIKKGREEAESMRSETFTRLEELYEKISKWSETNEGTAGPELSEVTRDIYEQLRITNASLLREKERSDAQRLEEVQKYRLLEEELSSVRQRLDIARNTITELEKSGEGLVEQKTAELSRYKVEADAFRTQNVSLVETNNQLKAKIERVENELSAKTKEMEPLSVKISALEAQLQSAQEHISMLTAKEKEWSARSAEILAKYNQIDPKEVESLKAENERIRLESEAAKAEFEKANNELQAMKDSVAPLNDKIKSLESELESTRSNQASLVANANQRQRFALELKNRLTEANKKVSELEAKVVELQTQLKEASTATVSVIYILVPLQNANFIT